MGAASTDRLVQGRRSRRRKARWPRKYANLKNSLEERYAANKKQCDHDVSKARMEREAARAECVELKRKIHDFYLNGPAVVEITGIKQRWFGARLWWAIAFFLTNKLRFERI